MAVIHSGARRRAARAGDRERVHAEPAGDHRRAAGQSDGRRSADVRAAARSRCGRRAFRARCSTAPMGSATALIDEVPGVIDWFAAGVGGVFELAPGQPIAKTARLLAEAGYAQSGFHSTLVGPVGLPDAPAEGVEIVRVEDAADLEAFSDVYHRGWGHTDFRIPMAPWLTAPGWSLYLARLNGEPAGAAILYVVGEDGYLADGAVDPAFRRHGVHRALLDRRCADAAGGGGDAHLLRLRLPVGQLPQPAAQGAWCCSTPKRSGRARRAPAPERHCKRPSNDAGGRGGDAAVSEPQASAVQGRRNKPRPSPRSCLRTPRALGEGSSWSPERLRVVDLQGGGEGAAGSARGP